jgi:hypothetical protein
MLEATDEPAEGAFVADALGDSRWQIDSRDESDTG